MAKTANRTDEESKVTMKIRVTEEGRRKIRMAALSRGMTVGQFAGNAATVAAERELSKSK